MEIKVYIAAKRGHVEKLKALVFDGIHINARWIDTAELDRNKHKPVSHWQQENFDDIDMAHFFILYVEPGDILEGALVETGYAIRAGKKVWIAGDGHGVDVLLDGVADAVRLPHKGIVPWGLYRQSVRITLSIQDAFLAIKRHVRKEVELNSGGNPIPPVDNDLVSSLPKASPAPAAPPPKKAKKKRALTKPPRRC